MEPLSPALGAAVVFGVWGLLGLVCAWILMLLWNFEPGEPRTIFKNFCRCYTRRAFIGWSLLASVLMPFAAFGLAACLIAHACEMAGMLAERIGLAGWWRAWSSKPVCGD